MLVDKENLKPKRNVTFESEKSDLLIQKLREQIVSRDAQILDFPRIMDALKEENQILGVQKETIEDMFKDEQRKRYHAEAELEYFRVREKRFESINREALHSSFDDSRHTRSMISKKKKKSLKRLPKQIFVVCVDSKS